MKFKSSICGYALRQQGNAMSPQSIFTLLKYNHRPIQHSHKSQGHMPPAKPTKKNKFKKTHSPPPKMESRNSNHKGRLKAHPRLLSALSQIQLLYRHSTAKIASGYQFKPVYFSLGLGNFFFFFSVCVVCVSLFSRSLRVL